MKRITGNGVENAISLCYTDPRIIMLKEDCHETKCAVYYHSHSCNYPGGGSGICSELDFLFAYCLSRFWNRNGRKQENGEKVNFMPL